MEAQSNLDLSAVYAVVGFLIVSNLGVIVTIIVALFKGVYKFALVESKTIALHERLDSLEDRISKQDDNNDKKWT